MVMADVAVAMASARGRVCGRRIGDGRYGGVGVGGLAGRRRRGVGADGRAIGGTRGNRPVMAEKGAEVAVLGSCTNRCAVGCGCGWGWERGRDQLLVQVQRPVQSLESILALGLARGAPLREQKPAAHTARFRTLLEVVHVGRRDRGDFHMLRVTRARARGKGDSPPYHSYCFEEIVAQMARNSLDNVVYWVVREGCNLPVVTNCSRLLLGILGQIGYSAGKL
jgi:hypothetical protein